MKNVKIGNKIVGDGNPCLISLEPGSTFTNIDEAIKLTSFTAKSGANAVKFQTLRVGDAERYMAIKDIKIDFTTPSGKKQELMLGAIKRKELSDDDWKRIRKYSKELGLIFIATPAFPETVDLLEDLKVDALKVSKGDINNVLLIEKMAQTQIPIILDAREKFSDVDKGIEICKQNDNDQIIIMHCPSGYPVENSGVHLKAISAIKEKYDYPVGFADHSYGDLMNYPAIALGVNMLEKTITLDKNVEKTEHFMSLEPQELKPFIENIRAVEQAMGDANILNSSRVPNNARRSFVAKTDIKIGEILSRSNLDYKRPGDLGIPTSEGFNLLGKKAKQNIKKETVLQWEMFE
ncbi:MAG: N-acetylneuraminate synthase family protein [Nitrosopumilaceae archaeon]